ncbi:MAG: 2'-5' RNA ligase family protein [Gemmatimonadetes bacterium]|jgi:2'-5' RNA ligase|nr:2'-5' RNA ligase family protein [Gemmatimonadota bacterium]MBT6150127.1 2'-5' RNA ligase family protein [Gemmatimonadota bacterium]MBT7860260.1 2'-5' RNA ligase family protein [Gemmatimonadota bacterium]
MTLPRRAIHIFPVGDLGQIEACRKRFDTLSDLLPPHITLVFPFRDALLPIELSHHMQRACAGIDQFRLTFTGPALHEETFLVLDVDEGQDTLSMLHERLYEDILAEHRPDRDVRFPHLTVGRLPSPAEAQHALREASTLFTGVEYFDAQAVVCEIIGDDESSSVEIEIPLG